jgi:hypothetical protein
MRPATGHRGSPRRQARCRWDAGTLCSPAQNAVIDQSPSALYRCSRGKLRVQLPVAKPLSRCQGRGRGDDDSDQGTGIMRTSGISAAASAAGPRKRASPRGDLAAMGGSGTRGHRRPPAGTLPDLADARCAPASVRATQRLFLMPAHSGRNRPGRPAGSRTPARPGTATINDLPQPAQDTRRGPAAAGIGTASPPPVPPARPGRCPPDPMRRRCCLRCRRTRLRRRMTLVLELCLAELLSSRRSLVSEFRWWSSTPYHAARWRSAVVSRC